jgi:hypothetical protein
MNKHFERWVLQVLEEMEGTFTVDDVRTKILDVRGYSKMIESNNVIGYILNRECVQAGIGLWKKVET